MVWTRKPRNDMTAEEMFREAFAALEVNDDFSEAVLRMRDSSRLCFCHRVGERWARAVGDGDAGRLLPSIAMFRLNGKHLEVQFQDSSRWEARFRAEKPAR
jgi:hypothetical protein